jgi:hypothetical protein
MSFKSSKSKSASLTADGEGVAAAEDVDGVEVLRSDGKTSSSNQTARPSAGEIGNAVNYQM